MTFNTIKGLNRRQALLATGGMIAAPFILKSTSGPAEAAAPMLGASTPNHYRFKLGDFEVTTILDGSRAVDGPHPIFGQDQTAEDVAALMEQNHLPSDKIVIGFSPVLVNTGQELVLFDTGFGGGGLTAGMKAAGYTPDQVDVVVITHFHPDHISGTIVDGKPVFPNARYVTGQTEYDFWTADGRESGPTERVAKLTKEKVVPLAEKTTFIGNENDVVSGITGLDTFGHTPGHMAYQIESNGKRILIWGDAANHFVASIQRPDWHVRFDMDKEMAAATRKKIFDMAATDRIPVTGYHMPFPALGYIEKAGTEYRWVPVSYQLDL